MAAPTYESTREATDEGGPVAPSVLLLGPVAALDPLGSEIDLGPPKQKAVLALLALAVGQVIGRDQLIDLVWNGTPPNGAVTTIQSYISNLRRSLEPDRPPRAPARMLVSRGGGYSLDVSPDAVDAHLFQTEVNTAIGLAGADPARAASSLRLALSRWRGPALADFAYQPFAAPHIARLEELRVAALEARIEADVALGAASELVSELEDLIVDHPLRERLYGLLMTVLYRSGRQAEALRVYRRCEARLAEELGISPGNDLQALEEAILLQDPSLNGSPQRPSTAEIPASTVVDPALVGRDDELAAFEQALNEAGAGRGSTFLIEGEPGVGKTALMEEMLARARFRGVPAALARCVEIGGTPPFWPWIQVSRGFIKLLGVERTTAAAGPHAIILAPFFPELAPDPARARGVPPGLPPHQVAQGIVEAMRRLTADTPTVMLIDDLYGADPDSLTVLTLLAAEVDTMGLVLVASHRSHRPDADHLLAHALDQIGRFPRTQRLALRPFTLEETGELVRRLTGDSNTATVTAIHQRSDGNALFAAELARLLREHGDSALATTLPNSLREVIRQRLTALSPTTAQMLRVAAVRGRTWEVTTVASVLGVGAFDLADAVEEAVDSGLVNETARADRFRFAHVLITEALAHGLGALRRAEIHRRVSEVLEDRHGDQPEWWAEIAHHAVEAVAVEGLEKALAALARAGRHALDSNAYESAEDLLQRRLDLALTTAGKAHRDREEIAALLDLAVVWTWRHGYQSTRLAQAADRIMELIGGGKVDDPRVVSEIVLPAYQARVSVSIVSGLADETARVVDRLDELARIHTDDLTRFTADLNGLVTAVHQGDVRQALERRERAEALLDVLDPGQTGSVMLPLGQQSLVATHRAFGAWALWLAGRTDDAREDCRLMRLAVEGSRHAFTRAFAAVVEALVGVMEDDPVWVMDTLRWGRKDREEVEFGLNDVWLETIETWSESRVGDPDQALARMEELTGRLREMGALVVLTLYRSSIVRLNLRLGRPQAALDEAEELIGLANRNGERFWYPELERLAAAALVELGRGEEARAALARGRAAAVDNGEVPLVRRIDADLAAL